MDNYKAQLDAEQAILDKRIAAVEKFNAVAEKSADVLASAFGGSSAVAKGAAERQSRQRILDAGADGRGGRTLRAGDPKQLAAAKKLADVQQKVVAAELARLKTIPGTLKQQKALQKELKQLQNTSKDAAEALLDVAESSAKIDELKESLDNAKQVREQQFNLLKDFVLASQEGRADIANAANGILAAVNTGTLQNQSPEQRQATFGLLDQLSDVVIGNTGLTGKQVQQELIFRDAINLGFPPELAKELATSTSVEEQILTELQKQTQIQEQSARIGAAPVFSTGGVVYRADGGSIFKPKGTDTVPAMLTPGEFVIRKSAVDQIGVGNLQALNNGGGTVYRSKGGPVYRQGGGGINAANAQVAGGRVQIISGDQFRQILATGLRTVVPNTALFGKTLKAAQFNKDQIREIVKSTKSLGNAGLIESGKFGGKAAQDVATGLNFLSSEGPKLFSEASGNRVTIRNGRTVGDYVQNYRPTLSKTINSLYGASGTFVNEVVKLSSGIDFRSRLEDLRAAADEAVGKVGGGTAVAAAKQISFLEAFSKNVEDADQLFFGGLVSDRIQKQLNLVATGNSNAVRAKFGRKRDQTGMKDAVRSILIESGALSLKTRTPGDGKKKRFSDYAKFKANPSEELIYVNPPTGNSPIDTRAKFGQEFAKLNIEPRDVIAWALKGKAFDPFTKRGSIAERIKTAQRSSKTNAGVVVGGQFGEAAGPQKQLPKKFQEQLNFLRSTGLYLAKGGGVSGQDTVPAMLTPGEFVMSPESVQKYGVGYMKQLNKGQVPGFRRGGLVGGTKYLANGGESGSGGGASLSIDTTNIQGVFSDFGATLKENLDNIVNSFSSLSESMNSLASAFSSGMTVQHQFSGDMTLAFNITNGDVLKNQIAEAITPKLQEIITTELDRRLSNNNFRAGS